MSSPARKSWADTFRKMRLRALEEASANALRVFVALESFAGGGDGYAWPSIAALQEKTQIKKRDTVFFALTELESLGIVCRRKLTSRHKGFVAPNIYRIGRPVGTLPQRMSKTYIINPNPKHPRPVRVSLGQGPEKRDGGAVPKKGTAPSPEKRDGAQSRKTGPELNELEPIEYEEIQTPIPACPVGSRQDHRVEAIHETETAKSWGDSSFPLVTIEPRIQNPPSSSSGLILAITLLKKERSPLSPVLAYLDKHGKLPEYIIDETHLIFDSQGFYRGYVDREGKQRDEWNRYVSIQMAVRRENEETMRRMQARINITETTFPAEPIDEQPPRPFTRKEKLEVVSLGTDDRESAERWSERSGIPAGIFLIHDRNERAAKFRDFLDAKKASAATNGDES